MAHKSMVLMAFLLPSLIGWSCGERPGYPERTALGAIRGSREASPDDIKNAITGTDPLGSGPGLRTGARHKSGEAVVVACRTCHQGMVPPASSASGQPRFHSSIRLAHGHKTCQTCHHAPHYDELSLADGTRIPASQVMQLCGQCHSRRLEEYLHGAHGGTSGYWDRSNGPQVRNHCLHCHDPHRPAIAKVRPAAPARNR